jgi:hypothetical protein
LQLVYRLKRRLQQIADYNSSKINFNQMLLCFKIYLIKRKSVIVPDMNHNFKKPLNYFIKLSYMYDDLQYRGAVAK